MRLRLFDVVVFLGCAGLLGYFVWHASEGPRSFANHERLLARVATVQGELDEVRGERKALEARVGLMRPESVDPDFADELARERLGYVKPDEIVVRLAPVN